MKNKAYILSILILVASACTKIHSVDKMVDDVLLEHYDDKSEIQGMKIIPIINLDINIHWGKFHRGKKVTNSGRVCDCEYCFGLCGWSDKTNRPVGFTHTVILNHDEGFYLYILESLDHLEEVFYVDEPIWVQAYIQGVMIEKQLLPGEYEVALSGIHYEDLFGFNSFARVKIDVGE